MLEERLTRKLAEAPSIGKHTDYHTPLELIIICNKLINKNVSLSYNSAYAHIYTHTHSHTYRHWRVLDVVLEYLSPDPERRQPDGDRRRIGRHDQSHQQPPRDFQNSLLKPLRSSMLRVMRWRMRTTQEGAFRAHNSVILIVISISIYSTSTSNSTIYLWEKKWN